MITLENARPEVLADNFLIIKLCQPTDGHTHQILHHNGEEWLRHSVHRSEADAMRYLGTFLLQVASERDSLANC